MINFGILITCLLNNVLICNEKIDVDHLEITGLKSHCRALYQVDVLLRALYQIDVLGVKTTNVIAAFDITPGVTLGITLAIDNKQF